MMDKAPDAFLTIGEMADRLGVRTHILRYWEEQFPMLNPLKRAGGRRLYRPADVALLEQINGLLHKQGYTIRGAVGFLQKGGVAEAPVAAPVMAASPPVSGGPEMTFLLDELQRIRSRLSAALAVA
jgi:DNA-binding transcriptional MerR regulator